MIKLDLSQGHESGSTYADQSLWYTTSKEKTEPHDHLNRCKESISQNSTFIHDKKKRNSCQTMGRKNIYLNIIKAIYEKLTANTPKKKIWKPSH